MNWLSANQIQLHWQLILPISLIGAGVGDNAGQRTPFFQLYECTQQNSGVPNWALAFPWYLSLSSSNCYSLPLNRGPLFGCHCLGTTFLCFPSFQEQACMQLGLRPKCLMQFYRDLLQEQDHKPLLWSYITTRYRLSTAGWQGEVVWERAYVCAGACKTQAQYLPKVPRFWMVEKRSWKIQQVGGEDEVLFEKDTGWQFPGERVAAFGVPIWRSWAGPVVTSLFLSFLKIIVRTPPCLQIASEWITT